MTTLALMVLGFGAIVYLFFRIGRHGGAHTPDLFVSDAWLAEHRGSRTPQLHD